MHLLLNKSPHLFSILVPHRALTTYLFEAVLFLVEVTRKYFLKIKKNRNLGCLTLEYVTNILSRKRSQ